jgi:methylphosphotriester-DNA--protein-cysteine methyltransferase
MSPDQFISAGHRLFGRKHWKSKLAIALGVDPSTIHRITHRFTVPGPTAVAIAALLQQQRQRDALDKEARKLLPKTRRTRSDKGRKKGKRKGGMAAILGPAEDVIP